MKHIEINKINTDRYCIERDGALLAPAFSYEELLLIKQEVEELPKPENILIEKL